MTSQIPTHIRRRPKKRKSWFKVWNFTPFPITQQHRPQIIPQYNKTPLLMGRGGQQYYYYHDESVRRVTVCLSSVRWQKINLVVIEWNVTSLTPPPPPPPHHTKPCSRRRYKFSQAARQSQPSQSCAGITMWKIEMGCQLGRKLINEQDLHDKSPEVCIAMFLGRRRAHIAAKLKLDIFHPTHLRVWRNETPGIELDKTDLLKW